MNNELENNTPIGYPIIKAADIDKQETRVVIIGGAGIGIGCGSSNVAEIKRIIEETGKTLNIIVVNTQSRTNSIIPVTSPSPYLHTIPMPNLITKSGKENRRERRKNKRKK